MAIDPKAADAVLDRIREDDLVELVLHLSSIESPPPDEGEAAEAIYEWLKENDFAPARIGMLRTDSTCSLSSPDRDGDGRSPSTATSTPLFAVTTTSCTEIPRGPTTTWAARRGICSSATRS
jgi:hypothetical protein